MWSIKFLFPLCVKMSSLVRWLNLEVDKRFPARINIWQVPPPGPHYDTEAHVKMAKHACELNTGYCIYTCICTSIIINFDTIIIIMMGGLFNSWAMGEQNNLRF